MADPAWHDVKFFPPNDDVANISITGTLPIVVTPSPITGVGVISFTGVGTDYITHITLNGIFDNDQIFIRHPYVIPVAYSTGWKNAAGVVSKAVLDVGSPSAAPLNIAIDKSVDGGVNWVNQGTIIFATGNPAATFSASGASFAVGDIMRIKGPNPHDTTAGNIGITLIGSRI